MATTNPTVTHEFSGTPKWYDVKLAVRSGKDWDFYRQALAVRFVPTRTSRTPRSPTNRPRQPRIACGTAEPAEQTSMRQQAQGLMDRLSGSTATVTVGKP